MHNHPRVLAALASAAVTMSLIVSPAHATPGHTSVVPVARRQSQATLAHSLAGALVHASSGRARLLALEHICAALGIAVEDAHTGAWIVPALRLHEQRGAVYTEELAALGWAFHEKRTVSVGGLAARISNAGYRKARMAVSTPNLTSALITAARASERRGVTATSGLLDAAVIRELSRAHGHDIASLRPAKLARLDPVQAWLAVEDFTLPVMWTPTISRLPRTATRVPRETHHLLKRAVRSPTDICAVFKHPLGKVRGKLWGLAQAALKKSASAVAKRMANIVPIAVVLEDAAHEILTNMTVDITHVTPAMPIPLGGPTVRFGTHVEMLYDYPETVVKCGYLAGINLPAKGDVPGIDVLWYLGALSKYGSTSPKSIGGITMGTTNNGGWSWLSFTPKPDPSSHGPTAKRDGNLWSFASVSGSLQGGVAQASNIPIAVSRAQISAWAISYHSPAMLSWDIRVSQDLTWPDPQTGGDTAAYRITGQTDLADGASGPFVYTSVAHESQDGGMSATIGACGTNPPDGFGTCDWSSHYVSMTSDSRFSMNWSQTDPDTNAPVDLSLSLNELPVETDAYSCSGDCGSYDATDNDYTLYGLLAWAFDLHGSSDSPGSMTLSGFKEVSPGQWTLRQRKHRSSGQAPGATSRRTADILWTIQRPDPSQ